MTLWLVPLVPMLLGPLLYAGPRGGRGYLVTVATGAALVTLILAALAIAGHWQGEYRWSTLIVLRLELSSAGAVFAPTVALVAAPILAYAGLHEPADTPAERRALARLLAVMLLFVGAMELLVLAADLLTLLLAWEIVGACSWVLIAHRWSTAAHGRDANWAFLVTRGGDLGLYLAAALLFAATGSFAYGAIGELEAGTRAVFAGGVLLAAAAKSAQVPFAPWLFAAMAGPTAVSALLHAATMVAAGVFLIARLHSELAPVPWFGASALAVGLVTALAGGLVASAQGHAKKLLAASTSAHYGLMWAAVGAGYPGAALLHFVGHALFKAPLFLAVGTVHRQVGSYRLSALGRARRAPGLAAATVVASLALAGVVPLGAAWTKEQTVTAGGHAAAWIAVAMALAGGLSALYATRLQLQAFGIPRQAAIKRRAPGELWPVYAFAVASLVSSLLWWPGAGEAVARWSGLHVLPVKPWELAVSLGAVAGGIAIGLLLVGRPPRPQNRWVALLAGWWGLPRMAVFALVRPVATTSARLAQFDDGVVDTAAGGAGRGTSWLSAGAARFDDGVVDAGLRASARLGLWLATVHARLGEALFDGAAEGSARGVDRGGRWARALQTGLAHQYFALMAAGLGAMVLLLALGGVP